MLFLQCPCLTSGRMFICMTRSSEPIWLGIQTVAGLSFCNKPGLCTLKIELISIFSTTTGHSHQSTRKKSVNILTRDCAQWASCASMTIDVWNVVNLGTVHIFVGKGCQETLLREVQVMQQW